MATVEADAQQEGRDAFGGLRGAHSAGRDHQRLSAEEVRAVQQEAQVVEQVLEQSGLPAVVGGGRNDDAVGPADRLHDPADGAAVGALALPKAEARAAPQAKGQVLLRQVYLLESCLGVLPADVHTGQIHELPSIAPVGAAVQNQIPHGQPNLSTKSSIKLSRCCLL